MNGKINLKKISIVLIAIYIVFGIAFYFIGGRQLYIGSDEGISSNNVSETQVSEILESTKIEQDFTVNSDIIDKIAIRTATHGRINRGNLFVSLLDKQSGEILFNEAIDTSNLPNNNDFFVDLKGSVKGVRNRPLCFVITSDVKDLNNSITLWSGKKVDAFPLYVNGQLSESTLNFSVECAKELWFGPHYWYIFVSILVLMAAYLFNLDFKQKNGKYSFGNTVLNSFVKYRFLLNQLIARDFKTKYKRSALGVLWSFLNPLLTMIVQYVVFSTVFKTDIPNFPVYLLIGIVVFNFFSESCGIGLMSIVGNASLITKVYVPKYIYPISRVLSSTINLLLSLIPLLIVMLITQTKIGLSIFLVPFGLICTLIFCMGVTFILSSAMVFFRDMQFLWNVISLLWMYATPIFYPESIIPERFGFILKINPMYHFIRFIRGAILNGVSPEPKAYLYCIMFSLGTFTVGALIFKKTQDKFVLNI